jgi:hypothetical protein
MCTLVNSTIYNHTQLRPTGGWRHWHWQRDRLTEHRPAGVRRHSEPRVVESGQTSLREQRQHDACMERVRCSVGPLARGLRTNAQTDASRNTLQYSSTIYILLYQV